MDLKGALVALEAEMIHAGLNQLTYSGKVSEIRVTRTSQEAYGGGIAGHELDALTYGAKRAMAEKYPSHKTVKG
jgi:hypothetical protein